MKYDFNKQMALARRVKQITKIHNLFLQLFITPQREKEKRIARSMAELRFQRKDYWIFELKTKKQKRDFDRFHMFLHNLFYDLREDLGYWGKEEGEKGDFADFMSEEEAIKELEKKALRISKRVLSKGGSK